MNKIRYVKFYADEWLVGTMGLPVEDVGVYIQACALIYSRGGPVDKADLQRVVRCHWRTFEACLRRLIDAGKLTLDGSMIGSKRCSRELQDALMKVASAVQNGSKGGRPRKEINELEKPAGSYARANGNQELEYKDSSNLKGEELGRCAPEEAPAPTVPEPPETLPPAPEFVAAPAPPESEPDPPPVEPTLEDIAHVDVLVATVSASLRQPAQRVHGIFDPPAYEQAIKDRKWKAWLDALHPIASQGFEGEARWQAWEAIDCARKAGSRDATPRDVRKLLDGLDTLRRAAEMEVAA
jgi:uncharacterized protein YdaU (DUF1376 family)